MISNYGKVISNSFADIPEYLRCQALSFYLTHCYPNNDFKYVCFLHTDEITEPLKISSNLRLVVKVKGSDDDTYSINKKGEHSQEMNNNFLLRLESREKTGVNEVHLDKQVIIDAIKCFDNKNKAKLFGFISDMKLDKKLSTYKVKAKNEILNQLIDIIIDNG